MTYEREVHRTQREVLRYLEFCAEQLGRTPEQMRVLDFGCGGGGAPLELRKLGYQAYGVDIDPVAVAQGMERLRSEGFDEPDILVTVDADGSTPLPEHSFDFVFSQEVMEHVSDLDEAASSLTRLMAPGGYGFHRFPGQRRPVEPHYRMPFVHWLPKNGVRRRAMLTLSRLGIRKQHPDYPETAWREQGERWFHYSVQHTFYRPTGEVVDALRRAGQDVCVVSSNHRRLQRSPLVSTAARSPAVQQAIGWTVSTFVANNLLTRVGDPRRGGSTELRVGDWRGDWLPATGRPAGASLDPA